MKKHLKHIAIILSVFIVACKSHSTTKIEKLILTAKIDSVGTFIISIIDERRKVITSKTPVVYVNLKIYNPNPDTISFLSMACSYEEFFSTNSTQFVIQSPFNCYTNFPYIQKIPPKSSFNLYKFMITNSLKNNDSINYKIKIGMLLIATKQNADAFELYEHRKELNGDMIWSNDFDLNGLLKSAN